MIIFNWDNRKRKKNPFIGWNNIAKNYPKIAFANASFYEVRILLKGSFFYSIFRKTLNEFVLEINGDSNVWKLHKHWRWLWNFL